MSLWLIVNDPNSNPTRLINLEHFKEYNIETSLRITHPDKEDEKIYGLYGYLEHKKQQTGSVSHPTEKILLAYFNSKNEATATLTKIIMAIAENDVVKKNIVIESIGGYYL